MLLAVLYPSYLPVVLALVFLDIFSHWFQMYSTLLVGATSHKVSTTHTLAHPDSVYADTTHTHIQQARVL